MEKLLDPKTWELGTADLIQQMAMLAWLNKEDEDEGKSLYQLLTGFRVTAELYGRLSSERDLETFQAECIWAIVAYIQQNPRATERELVTEIQKQIDLFKTKVDNL